MHAAAVFALFAAALSANAISVTSPNNVTGWSSQGTNLLVWDRVDTDPDHFTVTLTNTVS